MRLAAIAVRITVAATVIVISACQTVPGSKTDPDKALICQDLRRSLSNDLDLKAYIPAFGLRVKWGAPNEVTEERLVAVQDMLTHCSLWASGAIELDKFSEVLDRSATVYASGTDIAAVDARLASLEEGLSRGRGLTQARASRQQLADLSLALSNDPKLMSAVNSQNAATIQATLAPFLQTINEQQIEQRELARALEAIRARLEGGDTDRDSDLEISRYIPAGPPVSIYFATGSADLSPEAVSALQRIATRPDRLTLRVSIQGFADERGSQLDNTGLSLARAQRVETYLAGYGVLAASTSGDGETTAFDVSFEGNRRVIVEPFRYRD